MVLCYSPFTEKGKKENGQPYRLKLSIDCCHFKKELSHEILQFFTPIVLFWLCLLPVPKPLGELLSQTAENKKFPPPLKGQATGIRTD